MSRYAYDTDHAPPQDYEAVDGAVTLVVAGGLMVSGDLYLASNNDVHGHEEPVSKPDPPRWVLFTIFQQLGGQFITNPHDFRKVILHAKVVGEKDMLKGDNKTHAQKIEAAVKWHAALHARLARSLIGKTTALTGSEVGLRYRQLTEPSRPEYYPDTDTRESFALYPVTLQPNQ